MDNTSQRLLVLQLQGEAASKLILLRDASPTETERYSIIRDLAVLIQQLVTEAVHLGHLESKESN